MYKLNANWQCLTLDIKYSQAYKYQKKITSVKLKLYTCYFFSGYVNIIVTHTVEPCFPKAQ